MNTLTVPRESLEENPDYDVLISKFENGSSQRRLKSSGIQSRFKVVSPALTYTKMRVYKDFFDGQKGPLIPFNFISPNDGATYKVCFVPNTFRSTYAAAVWTIEFEMEVTK